MMDLDDAAFKALPLSRRLSTPAGFAREHFGFRAYPYQEEVLDAVLKEGKTRIAWLAGRRIGKTETVANVALSLAVQRKGTKTIILAPAQKQAAILLNRAKFYLHGSTFRRHVTVDNAGELRLDFGKDERGKPRQSVILASSMAGQIRGEGADVLIIDESGFCKTRDYQAKAYPLVGDKPDGIIIHISSLNGDDDHFMQARKTYDGLPRGRTFKTPSTGRPGVTPEMIAEWQATTTPAIFLREYLCDENTRPGGVFDLQDLTACRHDYDLADLATLAQFTPKRHHAYYLGVDWGKMQDRAVIAGVQLGTQHKVNPARLVFLQVYEPDPQNTTGHYARVIDDILRIAHHLGAARVVADNGEGRHQAEVLARHLGVRFVPFTFTAASRNGLVDNARFLVEKRALELPVEPDAVRQAFAGVHRVEGGYGHASRKGKDVFDAIALALTQATTAGEPERRRSMKIEAVGAGSGPIGLHGYQPLGKLVPDPNYWMSAEMRSYLRRQQP